jgi:hypothetical protein
MPRTSRDESSASAGRNPGERASSRRGGATTRSAASADGFTAGVGRLGAQAAAGIGDVAGEAGRQAREAASSLASQATEQVRQIADRQVSVGADFVAELAESLRAAADSLDVSVPQLAGLARGAAERIDGVSTTIREQSAQDLARTTASFARRHPAALFGAAALGGFLLVRLLSSASAGSGEDETEEYDEWTDEGWDEDFAALGEEGLAAPSTSGGAESGGRSHGE